jgi:hypothetical protein
MVDLDHSRRYELLDFRGREKTGFPASLKCQCPSQLQFLWDHSSLRGGLNRSLLSRFVGLA